MYAKYTKHCSFNILYIMLCFTLFLPFSQFSIVFLYLFTQFICFHALNTICHCSNTQTHYHYHIHIHMRQQSQIFTIFQYYRHDNTLANVRVCVCGRWWINRRHFILNCFVQLVHFLHSSKYSSTKPTNNVWAEVEHGNIFIFLIKTKRTFTHMRRDRCVCVYVPLWEWANKRYKCYNRK